MLIFPISEGIENAKTAEIYTHTHTHTHTRVVLPCLFFITNFAAFADDVPDLTTALQNTYTACVGIDDSLHDMKVMAGINTAITGVGTAAGIGATAVGFVKQKTDKTIEQLENLLKEMKELSNQYSGSDPTDADRQNFMNEYKNGYSAALKDKETVQNQIDELTKKSKNLGNWRTGLLAANTATNIAGAAIAGVNKVDDDLQTQINNCISAVQALNKATMVARINGEDISEATEIYNACREYEFIDVSTINKRATGAMVASAVGAGVGLAGTITSGVANSDKNRNDNTDTGKKKEKSLNTASNIMAIGATAASATATVFNATQIAAIKKVAAVSESCTGALK